jgi:hypothetical protein
MQINNLVESAGEHRVSINIAGSNALALRLSSRPLDTEHKNDSERALRNFSSQGRSVLAIRLEPVHDIVRTNERCLLLRGTAFVVSFAFYPTGTSRAMDNILD